MSTFWPFVIVGLTTGSIYSLAALGLVLTYKTSGVFNFAHGAMAAAAAYLFYTLHTQHGLPWPLAAALCLLVAAPLAGVVMARVAGGLADVPLAARIVATVGLLLAIQGGLGVAYGPSTIFVADFLPTRTYRLLGLNVGANQLIVMALAAAIAAGLYVFFRVTRLGVAMRGMVDDRDLLDVSGTSPARVGGWSWVIGSTLAAASGILLAPTLGLDALLLTLLVVQAFGAAAVGAFRSLPLTYLGGLIIGVGAALSTKYVASVPELSGLPSSFPFVVLFVALLLTRRGRLVEAASRRRHLVAGRPLPPALLRSGRGALLAVLIAVPFAVGPRLPVFSSALIFVLVFMSLGLLVRTSGQVSLSHAAFAAIGASAFAHLGHDAGLPWVLALVGAALCTVPAGALIAIPAIRLSGLYLALATFGFGLLVERMLFGTDLMFGGTGNLAAPRPDLGWVPVSADRAFYYVCLAVVLATAAGLYRLHRGRLGRLLRAMADSPVALTTQGAAVNVTRVLVFCISAFIAGLAGSLFASLSGSISGAGFGAFQSLLWLAVLTIAGAGELSSAIVAAVLLAVVPSYITDPAYVAWQPVLFGVAAFVAALAGGGRVAAVSAWFRRAAERDADRVHRSPVTARFEESSCRG